MRSLKHRKATSNWSKYILIFLLGIAFTFFVLIFFFQKEPESDKQQESLSETKQQNSFTSDSKMESSEQSIDYKQNVYPYKIDLPSNQSLKFSPKGNNVGTLHSGISVIITPDGNTYNIQFNHNYRDWDMEFHYSAEYTAHDYTIPTKTIFVRGYGSTPQRNVNVNTEILLDSEISNTGQGFKDWEGVSLYLFTASDNTLSLIVPDIDNGKNGDYIEYQQS